MSRRTSCISAPASRMSRPGKVLRVTSLNPSYSLAAGPVNSFEFQPCGHYSPGGLLIVLTLAALKGSILQHLVIIVTAWTTRVSNPVCSPMLSSPQRPVGASRSPSPLVFLPISTHSTATRNSTSALLKASSLKAIHGLSPWISSNLPRSHCAPLPSNSGQRLHLRFTAAAGARG